MSSEGNDLKNDLQEYNNKFFWRFKVKQAKKILETAKKIFNDKLVVAFSGGKDSLAALHLAKEVIGEEITVLYNNTTVEFPETLRYIKEITSKWDLNIVIVHPETSFFSMVKDLGWASHDDRWCCKACKEKPAYTYIIENDINAEITGTIRTESIYRRSLIPFKAPKKDPPIIRIHPIYDWNQWEVWEYIRKMNLPYNPLYDRGYRRIGCWCCPLNGPSHYLRLQKTHPKLYYFLQNFEPLHPHVVKLQHRSETSIRAARTVC